MALGKAALNANDVVGALNIKMIINPSKAQSPG